MILSLSSCALNVIIGVDISTNSFSALRWAARKRHDIVCWPAPGTGSSPFLRNSRCCKFSGPCRRLDRIGPGTPAGILWTGIRSDTSSWAPRTRVCWGKTKTRNVNKYDLNTRGIYFHAQTIWFVEHATRFQWRISGNFLGWGRRGVYENSQTFIVGMFDRIGGGDDSTLSRLLQFIVNFYENI